MIKHLGRALLVVVAAVTVATAADPPEPSRATTDRDLGDARARIAAKDWPGARDILQKAVARDPGNADYHNLFAYAIRHTANPNMDLVFKHYGEALRIDP